MKKRNGFTLIELLAVIVILAIIALISVPMVLKYIKQAKEEAGKQSIRSFVKAAETYHVANLNKQEFPLTISFPDADNTLNLKNANDANGYLTMNEDGTVELLITINDTTYAKNYNDDKIYNLNKDNYVYEGNPNEWIVSERHPEKLITWNPISNHDIANLLWDYLCVPYMYYILSVDEYPTGFNKTVEKKESLEESMKEFEIKYKSYMRYIPKSAKEEMWLLVDIMKNKFGASVTDNTLVSAEDIDAYFEEIKAQIPLQYELFYGSGNMNFRSNNKEIDNTTIIPGKVNGNKITKIARWSSGTGSSDDCDNSATCMNLYSGGSNYYYNLIISEGIEIIGDNYFNNNQVYSLKLPSTIKEIGNNAFQNNHIDSLTLPDGIIKIGNGTFSNNEITGKLIIPDSVTSISVSAFAYNKINEIVIPKGITQIYRSTFANNQITEVVIPESVTTIDRGAFSNNPIKKVTIEGDKTRFNDTWIDIGFPTELMPS